MPDLPTLTIDCDACVLQGTDACDDCIVTFLVDRPPGAVIFDADEERALRSLQGEGLAPKSRFRPDGDAQVG